jgi:hypothetical protein
MTRANGIVTICLLALVLFWPGYFLLPASGVVYALDVVNALGFTVGVVVLWRYSSGAALALYCLFIERAPLTKGPLLVLGIWQTWAAMVLRTIIIWQWRYRGEPDFGLDIAGMAFAAMLMLPGGACHLLASAMPSDSVQIPKLGARLLWSAVAVGLLLGAVIATMRWIP